MFAACGSNDNNSGTDAGTGVIPSASGVFPASAFSGRTLRVEVSGDATNFGTDTTLNFGDGVTVGNITVASPTDVFADLTIAPTAMLGDHDVTVTSGGGTYTLAKAFEIATPLVVETSGTFAQGSVAQISVHTLDYGNPFDATCGATDIFGDCLQYTGTTATLGTGTYVTVTSVSDYSFTASVYINTNAQGGDLSVVSGGVTSDLGSSTAIAARTATALTSTATNVTAVAGGTALYSFTTTGAALGQVVTTVDVDAVETLYLLPQSGDWQDELAGTNTVGNDGNLDVDSVSATAGTFYVIYVDDGQQLASTMAETTLALTPLAETEPNNTFSAAQLGSVPVVVTGGTLASLSDQDWIKITAPAGSVGKSIHVVTTGDPATDTLVDAFEADGSTSLGESDDSGYQENFTSDPIVANGTQYIEISASQEGYFDPAHNTYIAAIWIE